MDSFSNSREQTFNFLLDRITAQNTTIDILTRRLFSMDTRMDSMSQQIHTNTNRIDNLTNAVDTCSRRLDKNDSQQPFSISDTVNSTNKTNSSNTATLNTVSTNSTHQKLDLQDLPRRIRANIRNIEALGAWMGDIATSVESLEVQAAEQQEREERVQGRDVQGMQEEHPLAVDDMDGDDQSQDKFQSEGEQQLRQQQCQQQQQQDSKDESKREGREMAGDVGIRQDLTGTGGVVEQSDRVHLETEKGGADRDEMSVKNLNVRRRSEAEMVDLPGPRVIALGDNRVNDSPDHCAGNKGQADEGGLEDDVEDDVEETQQSIIVDNGGGSPLNRGAPLTTLFKKNSNCSQLFDQVASFLSPALQSQSPRDIPVNSGYPP